MFEPFLCPGCNVREPWEHRCHQPNGVCLCDMCEGKQCGCEECNPKIGKRIGSQLSATEALSALNILRSNIIATQNAGWSTVVYPLVAILNAAGYAQIEPTEEQKKEHLRTYGGAGGFPGRSIDARATPRT